jgi:hypothetical protein
VAGCCEHGNEPLVYIKGGECLDQLSILLNTEQTPQHGAS